MNNTAIRDQQQRSVALEPSRSFAVTAPAGSGKTGLLVQRALRLLAYVENPEEILCLTFTRKAAGEMQQRIHQALQLACGPEPEDSFERLTWLLAKEVLETDKKHDWQLLRAPGRLRITTIDSLCRSLAVQLGPESQLSENAETMDNPSHLYEQAIADIIFEHLEGDEDSSCARAVRTLLGHLQNDLNKLITLLTSLLQKRDQWLIPIFNAQGARQALEFFLQDVITSTLDKARAQLAPWEQQILLLADYASSNLLQQFDAEPSAQDKLKNSLLHCVDLATLPVFSRENAECCIHQWQGLIHILLTSDDNWRSIKGVNKRLGFLSKTDDPKLGVLRKKQLHELLDACKQDQGLRELLVDIRHLPSATYPDNQWQVLEALTTLLPILAAHLKNVFREQNQCDYSEVTLAALQALGNDEEPTDLALRLDYRIRHILVDEFQDTSTIQYELLRSLTRGWMPGDGRTLFVVGDGMQSLYGFRSANVGLFLEVRTQPLGAIQLQPLYLSSNFRSQERIIDWVNQVFARCFPQLDNINRGAVKYTPATAVHAALPEPAVTLEGFLDAEDPYRCEAKRLVELVKQAKTENPQGSIAVLVRDRGQLGHLLPPLREAGFSWQAQDVEPLARQMAVIDLLSLTRAFVEPADRIAWLSILRAPWCGLDLKDLYYLSNTPVSENPTPQGRQYPLLLNQIRHFAEINSISSEGKKILNRVVPLLLSAWQQRYRKTLRDCIEGLWRDLGGDVTAENFGQLSSCHAYLNLLEQHQSGGTLLRWTLFEQALQNLYAEPDSNGDPNLHVMTIHKAKGLEFDTVIIPGLNRRPSGGSKPLLLWREGLSEKGEPQLIISPREPDSDDSDAIFQHLVHEQKLKERQETLRIMYVGATRAIRRLHLIFSARASKQGVRKTSGSLLDSIWPHAETVLQRAIEGDAGDSVRLQSMSEQDELPVNKPPPAINTLIRLKPDFQHPEQVGLNSSITEEPAPESDQNDPDVHEESDAAITGTIIHRVMRQITLDGIDQWLDRDREQLTPFWRMQLQVAGCLELEAALEKIHSAVGRVLQDRNNHWIFDNNQPNSFCEYSLGYQDSQGRMRQAIVDRTFSMKDANGESARWIVDFKTAVPAPGETLNMFIAEQISHYQSQLDFYAQLLRGLTDEPIKTALYFPVIGHFQPLSTA